MTRPKPVADRVLTPEKVKALRGMFSEGDIDPLCDSHERLRAERDLLRAEVRTAFDAAFTLGAAFGCGLSNNAEAAKRLECVPTAAFCDEVWAKWQAARAGGGK